VTESQVAISKLANPLFSSSWPRLRCSLKNGFARSVVLEGRNSYLIGFYGNRKSETSEFSLDGPKTMPWANKNQKTNHKAVNSISSGLIHIFHFIIYLSVFAKSESKAK
jgi:hypothetical protein